MPLTWPWVFLYTTRNGAFCYGVGFAWSFRHILVTSLLVTALLDAPEAWLGARTYSLVLVQVPTATQPRTRVQGFSAKWLSRCRGLATSP